MERPLPDEPTPTRGPEHERLEVFLGDWRIEGKNLEGAGVHAGTSVSGTQKVEWMPGQFFLVQRETVQFAHSRHQTLWITRWDAARRRYAVSFFDSLGFTRLYEVSVDGETWRFEGQRERATLTFDEHSESYTGHWERNVRGRWVPLCEYRATRVH